MTYPGPYIVGTGQRSVDSIVTGPGIKSFVEFRSPNDADMHGLAEWVANHMNLAYKAGREAVSN